MATDDSGIPDSVTDPVLRRLYRDTKTRRFELKQVANDLDRLRKALMSRELVAGVHTECIANAMIAFRKVEDASMRLGKVLQWIDGGVSVYDKNEVPGPVGEAKEQAGLS